MPKLSLCITANDIPIIALFEILLTLCISPHHIKIESEHCYMDSTGHLVDCWNVGVDDFCFILPLEVIEHVGYLFDGLLDDTDSTFIEEVEIMGDLRSFVNNFTKLSQLICTKKELTHSFDLKCCFSSLIIESFFYSCHDVILMRYN